MKYILTIAITIMALSIANAQTPATKEVKATISINVSNATNVQAPVAAPATEGQTPTAPTAGNAPDNSAKYVGTNDLNLYLLRQGVKKA